MSCAGSAIRVNLTRCCYEGWEGRNGEGVTCIVSLLTLLAVCVHLCMGVAMSVVQVMRSRHWLQVMEKTQSSLSLETDILRMRHVLSIEPLR